MEKIRFRTSDEQQTILLATAVAEILRHGQIIALNGDLAAGKSVFSAAVLRHLGYKGKVTSPTYTIINEYDLPGGTAYHMDAYRLGSSDDLDVIGYYDIIDECVVMLIEWAEIIDDVIEDDALYIDITKGDDDERYFEMYSSDESLMKKLMEVSYDYPCH
ncbi:MAG: tRNA (adenosine(37)-N6)-threonylcarbamoyltransferase complex ATPase subunit type 1 TsaE [Anaerofustis stercorihominis]|nr:tRNA (adenosine(37)-N6)-threonylcarbamoyltransferase complex ATPase subunit type 1 TsaE [Anaerofustis stercorihominis]